MATIIIKSGNGTANYLNKKDMQLEQNKIKNSFDTIYNDLVMENEITDLIEKTRFDKIHEYIIDIIKENEYNIENYHKLIDKNNALENELREKHSNILSGVHIHCPEGAVHKDGPSAGTAITTTIYSLFNDLKIKHNIAITGEISLDGFITEIGGLDLKILGAIKAGVKEILFPVENKKDFDKFFDKYKEDDLIKDIKFYPVNQIQEVFDIVFE